MMSTFIELATRRGDEDQGQDQDDDYMDEEEGDPFAMVELLKRSNALLLKQLLDLQKYTGQGADEHKQPLKPYLATQRELNQLREDVKKMNQAAKKMASKTKDMEGRIQHERVRAEWHKSDAAHLRSQLAHAGKQIERLKEALAIAKAGNSVQDAAQSAVPGTSQPPTTSQSMSPTDERSSMSLDQGINRPLSPQRDRTNSHLSPQLEQGAPSLSPEAERQPTGDPRQNTGPPHFPEVNAQRADLMQGANSSSESTAESDPVQIGPSAVPELEIVNAMPRQGDSAGSSREEDVVILTQPMHSQRQTLSEQTNTDQAAQPRVVRKRPKTSQFFESDDETADPNPKPQKRLHANSGPVDPRVKQDAEGSSTGAMQYHGLQNEQAVAFLNDIRGSQSGLRNEQTLASQGLHPEHKQAELKNEQALAFLDDIRRARQSEHKTSARSSSPHDSPAMGAQKPSSGCATHSASEAIDRSRSKSSSVSGSPDMSKGGTPWQPRTPIKPISNKVLTSHQAARHYFELHRPKLWCLNEDCSAIGKFNVDFAGAQRTLVFECKVCGRKKVWQNCIGHWTGLKDAKRASQY